MHYPYFCSVGRILAIDYGKKRTGLAVTDVLQISTNGLDTVLTENLFDFLKKYLSREDVESIVVGEPLKMDDTHSEIEKDIRKFIKKLSNQFPRIPVHREDERFTSKMAVQTMIDGGIKKKKRREKELVDKVSATLILQSYLSRNI